MFKFQSEREMDLALAFSRLFGGYMQWRAQQITSKGIRRVADQPNLQEFATWCSEQIEVSTVS